MKVTLEFELLGDLYDLPDDKLVELVLGLYGKGQICQLKSVKKSQIYNLAEI